MADESAPENLDETPVPPTHSGRTLAMRFGLALGLMLLLILPTVFDAWRQKKRESTVTKADLQLFVANDPMYMENSYTIYTQAGGPCWIVDPGLPPQAATIAAHIRENDLKPQAILLTHGHADHIAGIDELREAVGAIPVYMAQEEWAALTEPDVNLSSMMGAGLTTAVTDPVGLEHGQVLELDGLTWQVLDTAGHSPGRTVVLLQRGRCGHSRGRAVRWKRRSDGFSHQQQRRSYSQHPRAPAELAG